MSHTNVNRIKQLREEKKRKEEKRITAAEAEKKRREDKIKRGRETGHYCPSIFRGSRNPRF